MPNEAEITKAIKTALKVVNHPTNKTQPVKALQKEFFICTATGKLSVMVKDELDDTSELAHPNYYTKDDAVLLMRRRLEVMAYPIEEEDFKYIYKDFFASPNTKVIKRFAFDPEPQAEDTHNFWIDPILKGKPGDWGVIKHWLYSLVCNGDDTAYEYLIDWLAHAYQKPQEKPGVMLVLMGKEGTGKGTMLQLLHLIFGKVVFQVDKSEQMVGKFNGVLNDKYFVWSDEAIFVGAFDHMNSLKHIITEPYITTELKHQNPHSMKSFHRFIAATNADHFSSISPEDRRFAFYRVSEAQMNNPIYWEPFWDAINNSGALDAFVYYLANKDISRFNPRVKVVTKELIRQKELSMTGVSSFLRQVLDAANFLLVRSNDYSVDGVPYEDEPRIPTIDFLEYYKLYDKTAERHRPLKHNQVKEQVKTIIPSVEFARKDNRQALQFPTLDVARQEFQRHLTHDIPEWNLPTNTKEDI